jgi:hypothetical protein
MPTTRYSSRDQEQEQAQVFLNCINRQSAYTPPRTAVLQSSSKNPIPLTNPPRTWLASAWVLRVPTASKPHNRDSTIVRLGLRSSRVANGTPYYGTGSTWLSQTRRQKATAPTSVGMLLLARARSSALIDARRRRRRTPRPRRPEEPRRKPKRPRSRSRVR